MSLHTPLIVAVRDADPMFPMWPWSRGPLFRLTEDWSFSVWDGEDFDVFHIPKDYEFDKASIPSFFWGFPFNYTPDGLCTVPALEHDFLCDIATGGSEWLKRKLGGTLPKAPTYKTLHAHFYHRLIAYGVRANKARVMWEGVCKFGPGSWIRPSTWIRK